MGNRAHVIFADAKGERASPAVYLHWNGGPESVYAFLVELDRRKVRADQEYEAARFVAIAAEVFDREKYGGTSLGIVNGPGKITPQALKPYDPGDNGIFVVCREGGETKVRRFVAAKFGPNRWMLREWTPEEVETEHQSALGSAYMKPDGIAAAFNRAKPIEAHN